MSRKNFPCPLVAERRLLVAVTVIQLLLLLVGILGYLLGFLLLSAGVAVAALLLLVGMFFSLRYFYYRQPVVSEKTILKKKLDQLRAEIKTTVFAMEQANRYRQRIDDEGVAEVRNRQAVFERQLLEIQSQERQSRADEDVWVAHALTEKQDEHLRLELGSAVLSAAKIPGIGPKIKERLGAGGIHTALDVSRSRIMALSGFGEAKTQALVDWREGIEKNARRTQPRKLPKEEEDGIRQYFIELREELSAAEAGARSAVNSDLKAIREKTASRHVDNDDRQAKASFYNG